MKNKIFSTVLTSAILVMSASQGFAGEVDRRVVGRTVRSFSSNNLELQSTTPKAEIPLPDPPDEILPCGWRVKPCDLGLQKGPGPVIPRRDPQDIIKQKPVDLRN